MPRALLVGSGLALLVAAVELGGTGQEVVLLTDGRPLGGHFRGARLDGSAFDLGMVLLERTCGDGAPGPLQDYDPDLRHDWTRFGGRLDAWLQAHVTLTRAPTPQCLLDGRRRPDHLVADRLDVVLGQDPDELPRLDRCDPRHAAHKTTSPAYDHLTYAEAAALHHGAALQARLVEPFLRKLGAPTDEVLARYSRSIWAPLYWPETLAAAAAGGASGLREYPFWTTSSGCVGDLVGGLERELGRLPSVVVDRSPVQELTRTGGGWTATTTQGTWQGDRPVLGVTPARAAELLGVPAPSVGPAASVTLLTCLVRGAAIQAPVGCLSVVDRDRTAYRLSDQDAQAGLDPEWHRVVVEAGPLPAGEEQVETLVGDLQHVLEVPERGDVRVLKRIDARGAIALPTAEAVAGARASKAALTAAAPDAVLTGALAAFGAASLNDQILQGLRVHEEFA